MQLARVRGQGVTSDLAPLSVVGVVPWLHLAQEVHHLGVVAVPVKAQRAKKKVRQQEKRVREREAETEGKTCKATPGL